MASELHRRLQALHAISGKGQGAGSAHPGARSSRGRPTRTRHTTRSTTFAKPTPSARKTFEAPPESLLGQAKLIQSLNRDLGTDETARAAVPTPGQAAVPAEKPAEPGRARLPDPLPPIDDQHPGKPKLVRQIKLLKRKIRHRKSA